MLPDENQGQDKRVESVLIPCLDAGSTPAISTRRRQMVLTDAAWRHKTHHCLGSPKNQLGSCFFGMGNLMVALLSRAKTTEYDY